MAPNGFLHAGTLVTLADTSCGAGCIALLPDGANGFTTIELKSNHLGTARDGTIECVATVAHQGKSTQVWDAAPPAGANIPRQRKAFDGSETSAAAVGQGDLARGKD